jgi:FkbM family methyltransferase
MNINNYEKQTFKLSATIGNITDWIIPSDDNQTFGIIVKDWFECIRPYLIDNLKIKDSSVIQAGGNFGVYPLLMTEFFSTVYTFEPDELNFYCLAQNCQIPAIFKFNCAIGSGPGSVVTQSNHPSNRGMIYVKEVDQNIKKSIPVIDLDAFKFKNIGLLQLDLEGYEENALIGAKETINENKPIIIVESSVTDNPVYFEKVKSLLKSMDYRIDKQISRLDTVFLPIV